MFARYETFARYERKSMAYPWQFSSGEPALINPEALKYKATLRSKTKYKDISIHLQADAPQALGRLLALCQACCRKKLAKYLPKQAGEQEVRGTETI
ncbi:hypothetical protein [Granulicella mallensis]|uniref:Uncharacterized protein n=1 Tax=Granulicella mallensis TaxID=940614 RepID=A0A7W7ZUJ3_9BACT|nr:hypothetical protein [Granulicella mallensis]MBB5065531.1 hypothetical protein [Granulicella mallensis]